MDTRARVDADGSIRLPPEVSRSMGWKSGSYLELERQGERLGLRRVEIEPFAEAMKAPSAAAFDDVLEKQQASRDEAFRAFEERVQGAGDAPEEAPPGAEGVG
ncbi:MAG: AbrB/MazE/SpoVT family DNA-binding domain-containing protein [Planctomycetota bacterium]|nr:AbrB/MazE/SpoVT family DNA-binding domain-containing protein [Planctomycetota bacterium]